MRSDYFERPVSFRVEEMASLEVVLSGAERQAESLYRKGSETMEKSKSTAKTGRALSRATTAVFIMLVMMVVTCQGQAAEVLIPLKDDTAILGGIGHFFCQILGDKPMIRYNGKLYSENPHRNPDDIFVEALPLNGTETDAFQIFNVTIFIDASKKRNNTIVSCSTHDSTLLEASVAVFIVQGGPAEPEVDYEVLRKQKEILLSWPRPFTWEDYGITKYHIGCMDSSTKFHDTFLDNIDNRATVNHTVKLPQNTQECNTLQCNVTAFNLLNGSTPSVTDISIPLLLGGDDVPTVQVTKSRFTEEQKPEVTLCVKLPVLCAFQNVTYTIIISQDGETVLELVSEFSYSSGYSGECKEELVTDRLQEGQEYSVRVFVNAGLSGNSSSAVETFKPELLVPVSGVSPSGKNNEEFFRTDTGIIVAIVVGTLLVILLLILVTVVVVSYRRSARSQSSLKAPLKRTTTPMVTNPIYAGDDESPYYEQVRPLHLKRFNSTSSHSNLDSPFNHVRSPSRTPSIPASPHQVPNNRPTTPGSTSSGTVFAWPYSSVQQPNAATFDAIEADVENATRLAMGQTCAPLPTSTPGEESYMTMHSAANAKNVNVQNSTGNPRYAIDIHGNRYIEC